MKIESIQTGWTLVSSSVMAYLTPTHSAGSVIYKITENIILWLGIMAIWEYYVLMNIYN